MITEPDPERHYKSGGSRDCKTPPARNCPVYTMYVVGGGELTCCGGRFKDRKAFLGESFERHSKFLSYSDPIILRAQRKFLFYLRS